MPKISFKPFKANPDVVGEDLALFMKRDDYVRFNQGQPQYDFNKIPDRVRGSFIEEQCLLDQRDEEKRQKFQQQLLEIKERLEHEHEVETRASRARKATTSLEKEARDSRLSRINLDRDTIGEVW